ncbi:P1 family peptidase [Defluviimonas sp. SAOS-178_SWC]|uniref:DmpA family aminopeptidase n=1 Tax=Defluviimonas sp. SAOS-178_SWC TaxID=3121287 RepID=UPI0032220AD3
MPSSSQRTPSGKLRAAGLGLRFEGRPGPLNAITDVPGVGVGYATIIDGKGTLKIGKGPVRTGVTAILPRPVDEVQVPVFAGFHSLNGNGELTGVHYIAEAGKFALPITITNTHSCGLTRDATIRWAVRHFAGRFDEDFALPVAAETYDGFLNDINGFHVTEDHVFAAIESAATGPIEEGSVGGGTGMKCFGFKAGSGTASRWVSYGRHEYMLGAFVQANFGARGDLTVLGHRIGGAFDDLPVRRMTPDPDLSSIIAVIATDAPFLPHQLKRLAQRAGMGVGRMGGFGRHGSGDIFLAFSTANRAIMGGASEGLLSAAYVPDEDIDGFFEAAVQSVEEAILNSMIANADMEGRDGNFVPAIPHDRLLERLGLKTQK